MQFSEENKKMWSKCGSQCLELILQEIKICQTVLLRIYFVFFRIKVEHTQLSCTLRTQTRWEIGDMARDDGGYIRKWEISAHTNWRYGWYVQTQLHLIPFRCVCYFLFIHWCCCWQKKSACYWFSDGALSHSHTITTNERKKKKKCV